MLTDKLPDHPISLGSTKIKPRLFVTIGAVLVHFPRPPNMTLDSSLIATVAIRVAPNLTSEILNQLQDDLFSLKQCSLVSKKWREPALKWLFAAIVVRITATDPWSYLRWFGESMPGAVRDGR